MQKGDRVIYIPTHANGDINHVDCEHGIIKNINPRANFAHILYDNKEHGKMMTTEEPYSSKYTKLDQLVFE
jgi:hypothetical protein